ncbi:phosphoribosyltransferase [Amycolatopsis sp. GM8]|uniref:phosphoribosyltransferase n=1 Tax=Amycolatopsis sp. GM8 TaxID=2896530 RepID=UPI001F2EB71A|nr:phosphoribosyltransferase family protein [Amycolatopsis sp. GM8]
MVDDRTSAGKELGTRLADLRYARPVVLGLPRGGVAVAAPIATALRAPLDVVLVRKVGDPGHPELAVGAVGEDGVVVGGGGVSPELLRAEQRILLRRMVAYRSVRPSVPLVGRVAVLADDGIATGATMRAAIRVVRARGAARVILAVPVAAPEALAALTPLADRVECLVVPKRMRAVSRWYLDFSEVSDDEVVRLLTESAGVPT